MAMFSKFIGLFCLADGLGSEKTNRLHASRLLKASATAVTAGATVLVSPVSGKYVNVLQAVISGTNASRVQFVSYNGATATTIGKKIFTPAGASTVLPAGPTDRYPWASSAKTGATFGVHVYTGGLMGGDIVTVQIGYNLTSVSH